MVVQQPGSSDGGPEPMAPPPAPWELHAPIVDETPAPAERRVDPPLSVYGRERLASVCFGLALLLLAVAVDAVSGYARIAALVAVGALVVVGLRIWWTPVLLIESDVCTTSHHLLPKRRFQIDGIADLYLDDHRLKRWGDGRTIFTVRPILLRPGDLRTLRSALDEAATSRPVRRRVY